MNIRARAPSEGHEQANEGRAARAVPKERHFHAGIVMASHDATPSVTRMASRVGRPMKHTKAARKASFRFHANPASEAVLRVLRAYKRREKLRASYAVSVRVVGVWIVRR